MWKGREISLLPGHVIMCGESWEMDVGNGDGVGVDDDW